MKKTQEEKTEKRILGFISANRVEWERITENPELRADIIQMQNEYGFPLECNPQEMSDWLGWTEPIDVDKNTMEMIFGSLGQRREKLFKEIKELVDKYNIDPKWIDELKLWVINDSIGWHSGIIIGLPSYTLRKNDEGKWTVEIIITPETDLEYPKVIEGIKILRAKYRIPPPQPQSTRGNPRKLDWRPVWEWRKRHPSVTYEEIAKQLDRAPDSVRKALERLDKES
jgi:hypothetical protein